jgi:hypothetical protein
VTVLDVDRQVLEASFARQPFALKHHLVDHPLLSLEAIAQLADRLPPERVEHHLGDLPDVLPGGEAPSLENVPPGEIVRGIETNGCWMVLRRVEVDQEYGELLEEALEDVIPYVADREGGVIRKEGFIILSCPNSMTPSHFDPEHNMLLQIRGAKEMTVGSFADEDTEIAEIERYYAGGHRNIDKMPADSKTFRLEPGDGVYVPVHAPHAVRNLDKVSVSLSITFYTQATERAADIWAVNSRMRKLRLSPAPPGARPGSDTVKAGIWKGLRRGGRLVRSVIPRNGSEATS